MLKKKIVDDLEITEEEYGKRVKNPDIRLKLLNENSEIINYKTLTKLEE